MARNTTNNTTVVINLTTQGDGAKKATDQLEELKKKAEESNKQFETFQKQTEATVKALEGLGATGAAGEVVKGLADAGKELNNLATLAKTFEMTWQFTMGGATKQVGGLSAALSSIPKTIQVAIVAEAAVQVARLGQAVYEAGGAAEQAETSKERTGAQNDIRRKQLETLIDQMEGAPGGIGRKQADDMRAELFAAFTTKKVTTDLNTMDEFPDNEKIEIGERDVDREFDLLNQYFHVLTGQGRVPGAPYYATGSPVPDTADQKKALDELSALNQKAGEERLQGYARERQVVQDNYDAEVARISNLAQQSELNARHKADVDRALAEQAETRDAKLAEIDARQAEEEKNHLKEIDDLKASLTETGLTGTEKEMALEDQRYRLAVDHINGLKNLSEQDRQELLALNDKAHANAGLSILSANTDSERQQQQQDVLDDYDGLQDQASDNADKQVKIEQDKNDRLAEADKVRKAATSQMDQELGQLGTVAEHQFAAGLTNAFQSVITGSKSAGQAFKEFAASFLQEISQMIMELIIFKAIQAGISALTSTPSSPTISGTMGNGSWDPLLSSRGSMTAAAAGVMLAAAGIQGVNEVNGPTYFPKFNVLAGEAGNEVMTVFSKPQSGTINGLPVITGSVGPDKLAIMSQDSLSQLVNSGGNATRAAAGYMGGSGITGLSVASQSRQPDGRIVVELTPHPAYETRVIESSIAGARAAIASDLATDTPIRNQVKGVLS